MLISLHVLVFVSGHKMRAKPISVRFPIPKIAAAKLRDLAISRDPRLLELGILAVQITEHEKIVVSFGKPPYGKAKPKPRTRENPKKTRVKAARGRPKSVGTWSVSGTSITFPGVSNSWQDRNPMRHLNNKKVIKDKSNTKVERQAPKKQLHQTVYRRQDCLSASSTTIQNSSITAVTGALSTTRNATLNSRSSTISSNPPLKRAAEHYSVDNALQNGETKRSRAEIRSNEGVSVATPSPCPSDASSLSLSSTSPLVGEEIDRSRSSSSSSQNEQGCFSLTGIQETRYMGRQRALFDWFMNSNDKKFSASNRLRELAKGHGGEGEKETSRPESLPSGKIATINTIPSLPSGTNMIPVTSTSIVTTSTSVSSTCKNTGMIKTIPTPTPGIHRVKMSSRSLSGSVSMPHFSVREGLPGKQNDQVMRTSPHKNSIDKKSVSETLDTNSNKDILSRISNTVKQWNIASSQVNSDIALDGIVNSLSYTGEISNVKTEINYKNNTLTSLNCLNNEISTSKENSEAVAYPKSEPGKTELASKIFGQPDSVSVVGETKTNTGSSVKSNVNSVSNVETQFLTMPTLDANNNQTVPKSPLMYPYSTGMLSSPFTVDSKATARQGVVLGLQYATVKPQVTAFHQTHIPSQLTMQMNAKPELSRDLKTAASCATKPEASQAFSPLVQPHIVQCNPEARTLPQPVSIQYCQVDANTAINTSQTTAYPWTVTNISHSQSEQQCYPTNIIGSVPAFVAAPQIVINPHPDPNLQVFSNSQVVVDPQNTEICQNESQQTATTSAVTVTPKISSASQSDKSCSSHKPTVTQDSMLFSAAKENIRQQSGQHLDDVMRKVKTEDYTQSLPDSDKVSCSEVKKSDENQSIAAAPIQFIDLSGTLRYWQQWSLYYRSLIERQNAVAALLSMQNAVPSATAVTTAGNLHFSVKCTTEAEVCKTSSLTYSGYKEEKPGKQLNDDTLEKQIEAQSKKDTELLYGDALTTMNDQQVSKMQAVMCDKSQQLVTGRHSENRVEKTFANDEISSENTVKEFGYKLELSEEAAMSSSRKSVIVDTRTNECDFTLSDKPDVISKQDVSLKHTIPNSCKMPESNIASMENSTRSIDDKFKNSSSEDIPETEDSQNNSTSQKKVVMLKAVCELDRIKDSFIPLHKMEILPTEQVLDLNLGENGSSSPLMQDSEDTSSGLIPMARRLRSRRSSSNPLPPELSFIPESAIECVNVGGNKRGSNGTECAPPGKKRRSKRSL